MKIYNPNNNVIDYININNPKQWIIDIYYKIQPKNIIEIDWLFYKQANNLYLSSKEELLKHLYNEGIEKGYIYHPKQLSNIISNLKFTINNNLIFVNDIILNDFVKNNIYDNNYNYFLNTLIEVDESVNLISKKLIIFAFIGDLDIGVKLANKIKKYKNIQDFSLCIIYNMNIDISLIKKIINFESVIYMKSKEFGNDIIPSLLAFDKIKHFNFDYVIKIHTKSQVKWFDDITDFLFSKNLIKLVKKQNKDCNCISHPEYIYKNNANQNSILMEKYRFILKKKYFVRGTMFFCNIKIFNKVLNFVKKDYRQYLFNNMYDTNAVNEKRSPVHFLERIFGMIR